MHRFLLTPLILAFSLPTALNAIDKDNEFKRSFDDQYRSCEKKEKQKKVISLQINGIVTWLVRKVTVVGEI